MAVKNNHIHRFKRHTYKNGTQVYFCTLPDCNFKIGPEFSLGKRSICNVCGKEFIMNEYSVRAARPKCMDCVKRKGKEMKIAIKANQIETEAESITSLREKLSQVVSNPHDKSSDIL